MANEFIQEIHEDLQAERIRTIARRIGGIALAVVLACGIGAGIWGWQRHALYVAQEKASVRYMEAVQLRNNGTDDKKIVDILSELASNGPQGVRTYAAMSLADIRKKNNDTPDALVLWGKVEHDTKASPALQHMARYLSLNAQMNTAAPDVLRQGYQSLIQEGGDWGSLAREGLAILDMRADATQVQKDEARRLLMQIKFSPDSSEALRSRVSLLLQTLGDAG